MSLVSKKQCVVLTSCIGSMIAYFLPHCDGFYSKFNLRPLVYKSLDEFERAVNTLSEIGASIDLLIHHPVEILNSYPPELIDRYEDILSKIPPSAKISIGIPNLHACWPFHAADHRNNDTNRAVNRFGSKPFYHYGDSFVLNLLNTGLSNEEILLRYLDLRVGRDIDLDKAFELNQKVLEKYDDYCDIKLADYIIGNFRNDKLFQSVNHANNRLMLHVTNKILKSIGHSSLPVEILEMTQEILPQQMPIHPSIAKYFSMNYANSHTRYTVDDRQLLTFAEFMQKYINYIDGFLPRSYLVIDNIYYDAQRCRVEN